MQCKTAVCEEVKLTVPTFCGQADPALLIRQKGPLKWGMREAFPDFRKFG
jgi:hypothetical protein